MKSAMSENDIKAEKAFEPVPECEWHTKDPLTGEIFFLSKGILYSKLPSKEKQKIISINSPDKFQKTENPKKKILQKKKTILSFYVILQNFLIPTKEAKFKYLVANQLQIVLR